MPNARDLHTPIDVYVRLLGEGTTVYRPTRAVRVAPDVVRLLAPDNFDADEQWEFAPGSTVRIERRVLSGGEVLVAVGVYDAAS
jgi:hypothetical protein